MNAYPPRSNFIIAALALGAALTPPSAYSQPELLNYPNRAVTLIVPYTAGGSNDLVARVIGEKLSSYWHQPVIVENKPGAGGNLGSSYAKRAKADGYTLLITPNNLLTMNPFMYKPDQLGYKINDFATISLLATGPIVLAANTTLPVKSVKELIAYANREKKKLTYASAGIGTPHHLTAELFKSMANIDMLHVPYKGAVPAVTDLAAGRVDVMFGIPNSLTPFIKRGDIRALGVSSKEEVSFLPNIPTIDSTALPGFESSLWIGLVAPAATPIKIIDKISADVAKAVKEPDVEKILEEQGLVAASMTPAEFTKLVKKDADRWSELINEKHLNAE